MGWHLLVWGLVAALWAGWSLLCWMGQAVLGWSGWSQGLDWATANVRLEIPPLITDWLGLGWVNALNEMLVEWGPELHSAVSGLPDLSGWIGVLLGLAWGLGSLALLAVGGLASGLIALARRSMPPAVAVAR